MGINDIKGIMEMCDDALKSLLHYENTGEVKEIFKEIRSVGDVCIENNDIHPDLKERISIKKHYDFKDSIFTLKQLSSLSRDSKKIQKVRNCLNNVRQIISHIIESDNNKLYKLPTIFYSWQSTLPNNTNRNFIQTSIKKAIKSLNKSFDIKSRLEYDSDTLNIPGSPDIINSILRKIDNSAVFIADVSLINSTNPNSNVMFELGYAMKSLGDKKIIMIFNEAYGNTKDLPFDLGFKRQMVYKFLDDNQNKSKVRDELTNRIASAVKKIVSHS